MIDKFEKEYIWLSNFSKLKEPREAKNKGQIIDIRDDWGIVKYGVMFNILLDKFTRNKRLFIKLMSTEDEELIEGNIWHDNYLGTCRCDRCGDKGQNNLGKILMQIRRRFYRILES